MSKPYLVRRARFENVEDNLAGSGFLRLVPVGVSDAEEFWTDLPEQAYSFTEAEAAALAFSLRALYTTASAFNYRAVRRSRFVS